MLVWFCLVAFFLKPSDTTQNRKFPVPKPETKYVRKKLADVGALTEVSVISLRDSSTDTPFTALHKQLCIETHVLAV